MLRPAMKPADETPSGGGKRKPKPKPESRSNPYVAVPGDFLGPAPATPQTPSTANPPADRPAYGPENPPPPNYGGPPPVYPEVNAPSQTSSRSDDKKKPDKKKEASDKPQIAVPADFAQTEAKPDISALGLEFGWSRKFRLTHLQLETDNELVQGVAASLQHRRLFEHYLDDPIAYLKHFAEYGWDEESDRQAEAYIEKYAEEMKLHYAGQGRLWDALAWEATEHVREDLTNDRLESAVAVNIVTKEEIFRRFGDEDKTPLQEENRAMIKDPHNTALVHNHWNDSPGSQADFDAALWLGVRYLIVVTPSGMQYLYERDGDRMKLLDEIFNRERVALPSPAETVESRAAYEAQLLAEAGNPAERVMRQDEPSAVIGVSGLFRAYGNQWYAADRRGEPETFGEYDFTENSGTFRVLARSTLNPSLVQIEVPYPSRYDVYRQWINLEDLGDSFRVLGSDLESVPAKYPLRSFVADETLDIELIWEDPTWPDKSGVGVRSRDFNPVNSTQEFLLQSPTIGPDVIVEFVATGHYQLGNYVVISFPASVFQENELIMRRLSDDKKKPRSQSMA